VRFHFFLLLLRPSAVAERVGFTAPCPRRPGFAHKMLLPWVFPTSLLFVCIGKGNVILAQRLLLLVGPWGISSLACSNLFFSLNMDIKHSCQRLQTMMWSCFRIVAERGLTVMCIVIRRSKF
jgi:hypothetical protein